MSKNMDYHSIFRKKVIDYLRKTRKQITTSFRDRHESFIHLSRFDYDTIVHDFIVKIKSFYQCKRYLFYMIMFL